MLEVQRPHPDLPYPPLGLSRVKLIVAVGMVAVAKRQLFGEDRAAKPQPVVRLWQKTTVEGKPNVTLLHVPIHVRNYR